MPQGYHPTEVLQAFRQEYPHRFDDVDDGELLNALKDSDPDTYKLVNPQLIGVELLSDSRKLGLPVAEAPPPKPLPIHHPPPSVLDTAVTTGLRVGGMIGGGMLGSATDVVSGPVGTLAGGAAGAGAGDVAAQKYEQAFGLGHDEGIDWKSVGVQTALGAIPLGEVAGLGVVGRTLVRGGQGALLGTAGTLTEDVLHGQPPTAAQVATAFATGGAVGAGFHGASEAYGLAKAAPGNMSPEMFGLPMDALPPAGPAELAAIAQQARELEAQDIAKEFAKRGWEIPPSQRGSMIYGLQQKAYLDRLAELGQPPVAIPEVGAVPPATPPQLALPPSPIISYPPGYEPPEMIGVGTPPRGVRMQSTADQLEDQLHQSLMTSPEPPRLNTEKQLALTSEQAAVETAQAQPLLEGGVPPTHPQRLIQKKATPEQPYLPESTRPRPLDRVYAEGPNAGPRREGEAHGTPRPVRRRIETPGRPGYTYEQAPSTLPAEDPGTYPADVRRELARMLYELQEHPHERVAGGSTQGQLDALREETGSTTEAVAEARRRGATAGGAIPGAPVYHDVLDAAGGARAHATREDMLQDLRAALTEGKGSVLSDAAAQVARGRIAQEGRGGTTQEGYKAGSFTSKGVTRRQGYPIISKPGAGDALIGWTDESGAQATPEQDLTPEQQDARDASDGELLSMRRAGEQHGIPEGLEPHFEAVDRELWRRGLLRGTQPPLTMEAPGGAGGPSLLDFEGGPPKRPGVSVAFKRSLQGPEPDIFDTPESRQVERERLTAEGKPIPPELQESIPGLEGVREVDNPTPPVAEAPFTLTPPPEKPASRRSNIGAPMSERPSLLRRLFEEDGVLILDVPAGDRQGLQKWLARQEKDHGDEPWYSRVEQAIEDKDWDRAWKVAASASVRSYAKAADSANTPQDEALLRRAVKGTPLQADIQSQIVGQARKSGIPKEDRAPTVTDFPPSYQVSQAGAARGSATLGPAGVINPGPPKRPLEGKYTDFTLSKGLQQSLIEASDPDLLHLIPGNTDTHLRLYRQIADLAFRGANTREVKQYLKLPDEEIAQHFLRGVREAARTLQQLSAFRQIHAKTLDEAAEAMSMGGALEGMLGGPPPKIVGARGREIGRVGQTDASRTLESLAEETRSFDQAMLVNTLQKPKPNEIELLQAASYPFMISKWATAVRNAITQAGRYGVEALDDALTIPLGKLLGDQPSTELAKGMVEGRLAAPTRSDLYVPPTRAWKDTVQDIYDITADTLSTMSPEDGRATLQVLTEFPTEAANFLGWASTAGEHPEEGPSRFKLINSLLDPKLQKLLTVFNRAQEFTGRALVFDASMRAQLKAKGLEPNEVLLLPADQLAQAVGGATALDELVHNSVASALEATFAARLAKNSIPAALVRFVNSAWPLKLGYPFPRFNLASAPRFIWDHGPWALLDLVRFPIDLAVGAEGGGRLTRGIRAQQFEQRDIPELVGKRQASEGRLGSAVRDLVASRRELAVRSRMVNRLQRKANAGLPNIETPLQQAIREQDALQRRATRAQEAVATEKSTIRDLHSQEEKLLDAVRDAHGIGAPTLPQFFARVGTGTFAGLGAAFVVRSQPGAQGTRWYEYRVDREGKDPITLDFRPFAPFAQYLYVADVMQDFYAHTDWKAAHQQVQDEGGNIPGPIDWSRAMWQHYTGKYTAQELGAQFAQAFLSMSRAAGTTLTITDLLTQNGWPSLQDAADSIIGTVGQFLSRFTVPAQQLKDIAGAFDPEEAKVRITPRATLEEPFRPLAAPIANLPYASEVIPDRISQTTGQPVATEYPMLRALAGIGTAPKDFVTEEVQRVGVAGPSVFIRETGDYGLDRMIAESYSRVLQEELPGVLEDPQYVQLGTPADQRDYLTRWIFPALKRAALAEARQSLGEERYEGATVRGEAARKKQRQLDLLDRLGLDLGPAPPDDTGATTDLPPGPPSPAALPPEPP